MTELGHIQVDPYVWLSNCKKKLQIHLWGVKSSWEIGNTCNESIKWKKKERKKCERSKGIGSLVQLTSGSLGWERISRPSEELFTHSSSCLTKGKTNSPNPALQSHSPQHSGTFGGLRGMPCVFMEVEGCEMLNLLLSFSLRTTCLSRVPQPTATTATAGWSWWTPSVRKRCLWDMSKSLKYDPPQLPPYCSFISTVSKL